MRGGRWMLVWCLAAALLLVSPASGPAAAQSIAPPVRYAGRAVIDVLQDLNVRGLRVVFSTVLVKPTMRVATEPPGPGLADILDQVLRPHGLQALRKSNGALVVTRAPRAPVVPEPVASRRSALRGRVVDAVTEQPLADAVVAVHGPERRVATDRDGRFAFADLEPGVHELFVSLVGYVLSRRQVIVPAEGDADVLVPLTAGAGAYTEQLTIVAEPPTQAAAGVSQFTMRSAELQDLRGVLAEDPLRALQTMPGAATGDDFRSEFSVRGSALRQMGFAVDGIPAPWLVHGVQAVDDTGTIAMISADVLDEVTLTAGAAAQPYGNRTGAWVDTILREGSRDAVRLTGSLSATGASGVVEGPLGGARRGAWLVSARQSYIDWLLRQLDREDATTFGFSDAQAKVVFDVRPRHRVQFTAVAGRSTLQEGDESPTPNGTAIGRSATGVAIVSWQATLGSTLVLTQRAAASGLRYRNTNAFRQDVAEGRASTWTGRSDAWFSARPWLALHGTVSLDRDWASGQRAQYSSVGGTVPGLRSWSVFEQQRWRIGQALNVHLTPARTVSLDAGARHDHEDLERTTTWSPWAVARWDLTDQWTLRAGAGRAAQMADLLQVAAARHPLVPERARYLDGSVTYRLTPAADVHLAVYDRQETEGLFLDSPTARLVAGVPVVPFASGLWANRLEISARGVEVFLRRRATQGVAGWVSYAYGRTRQTDTITGERYWGDFDQRHTVNLYATTRLSSRTSASARFRLGSNMPVPGYFDQRGDELVLAPTRNTLRLPTYARLDLRVNRTYNFQTRRLTLFAEVINVLNRENLGLTDGTIRSDASVTGFVEKLFPVLPSVGLRVEF